MVLLGLVSRVRALSAVGDCLGAKGLLGLIAPALIVQVYPLS